MRDDGPVLLNARILYISTRQIDVVAEQSVPADAALPVHHGTTPKRRVNKSAGILWVTVPIQVNPRIGGASHRREKRHASDKDSKDRCKPEDQLHTGHSFLFSVFIPYAHTYA